jgi:hypothetical protein
VAALPGVRIWTEGAAGAAGGESGAASEPESGANAEGVVGTCTAETAAGVAPGAREAPTTWAQAAEGIKDNVTVDDKTRAKDEMSFFMVSPS